MFKLLNETNYTFGSPDNARRYDTEVILCTTSGPSSIHGVRTCNWSIVIGASGGATGIHSHSSIFIDNWLLLAVGDQVCCINGTTGTMNWHTKGDEATCFGLHYDSTVKAVFIHGEIAISRMGIDGSIQWSTSGADIFTGELVFQDDNLFVSDFSENRYQITKLDGSSKFLPICQ